MMFRCSVATSPGVMRVACETKFKPKLNSHKRDLHFEDKKKTICHHLLDFTPDLRHRNNQKEKERQRFLRFMLFETCVVFVVLRIVIYIFIKYIPIYIYTFVNVYVYHS